MTVSTKVSQTHLDRTAVLYLRQSSTKQVLQNKESAANQRALAHRLHELGWAKEQVHVIDEDQGLSGKAASGREGFQKLVADVGLRKVGIVMGYEVSRLSRSSADWHRLVELCSVFDTLIGDADGIYNPRDFNDRLLLGLKGTMSEAELHSLRLRLDAGRLSKAKRGELVHHVPTGYVRTEDGKVILDPDQAVRERILLLFRKFLELGTMQKVLRYLVKAGLKLPRRQTSGLYAGDVLWKEPAIHALHSILKNPAYAGAFAYGRRVNDPTRQIPGRRASGKVRKPRSEWIALVRDVYPAYITWDEDDTIQRKIQENAQRMKELIFRKLALRKGEALLTGMVRCGKCGAHMSVSYKERGRYLYTCARARSRYGRPSCQFIPGDTVDGLVVREFLQALQPVEIDALEAVTARSRESQGETVAQLEKEEARLVYEARRAERQYNLVDPENRLIAASLEKKWENALRELEEARLRLAQARAARPAPVRIPDDLKRSFAEAGRRMPEIWSRLRVQARKALLRTLVSGVNLLRREDRTLDVRIAWRGGLATEAKLRVRVFTLRGTDRNATVVARMRELAEQGLGNDAIAERLNAEGFLPARGDEFTRPIVVKIRLDEGIPLVAQKVRDGGLAEGYTVREVTRLLGVNRCWIYGIVREGRLKAHKDPKYGAYLFPRGRDTIEQLRRLRNHEIQHLWFRKGQ
jgi:DNA invertase Pin-like site-specific DNA recombinase